MFASYLRPRSGPNPALIRETDCDDAVRIPRFMGVLLRQFLDPQTSTLTYLLADLETRDAVWIDPVESQFERDLQLSKELELRPRWVLETHVHADHISAAYKFQRQFDSRIGVSRDAGVSAVVDKLAHGDRVECGKIRLRCLATPGHTLGCMSFLDEGSEQLRVFTGDALLIRGCGRTDFQGGNAKALYRSIHTQIFSLPDETAIYPGHDYHGRLVSSVGEEKRFNARLSLAHSESDFVRIMDALQLAPPQKLAVAVPRNLRCGAPMDLGGTYAIEDTLQKELPA